MKILIQPRSRKDGGSWQVQLDQHCVSFRSETEAKQFVATLRARLQAPHELPWRQQRQAG